MAKGKAKGAKGAPKKETNWAKIAIPLLMVFIMVGSIFAFVLSNPFDGGSSSTGLDKPLDGIVDALRLLPSNASFVRYADMKADTQLNESMYKNYWNTLPPASIFNAYPQKDAVAVYPLGYFGNGTQNVVSLTDFGSARINKSYTAFTIYDQMVLMANSYYYFSSETSPVVSGGAENVAKTLQVMLGNNSSSYGTYSDLFDKLKSKGIPIDNMTLETAGKDAYVPLPNVSSLSYYAGIGPMKDRPANLTEQEYSYVAVIRLNRTPTDSEWEQIILLSGSKKLTGYHKYNPQIYEDYMVIEAEAPLSACMEDMVNWGFMKYKAGTSTSNQTT